MRSVRRSFSFADNDCIGILGQFSVLDEVITAMEGRGILGVVAY